MLSSASPFLSLSFVVIALVVAALFVAGNGLASKRLGETPEARRSVVIRAALATAAWMALTGGAAARGLLSRFDARPPPLLLAVAATLVLALAVGLSRVGARLAHGLSFAALVGVQAFRLPLELAMHEAARVGVMPERMTFTGANFDIVTGALAIPLAIALARGAQIRGVVLAWNALGLALLVNVVANAMLATPMIHAFGTAPRELNTFIAYFPFVWLPTVLVATALIGHIVIARRLLAVTRERAPLSETPSLPSN